MFVNNYGISKCSADINGSILHLICKEWIFPLLGIWFYCCFSLHPSCGEGRFPGRILCLGVIFQSTPSSRRVTVDETTLIYAQQKAIGDSAENMGLLFLHSYMYARYKAMGLVDYNKYTVPNALAGDVEMPTIGGFIPVVSDRFTVDTSGSAPVYKTYMIGSGSILTCDKTNYEDPYYADYDPETKAGIRKLYTKQGYVMHPNGFSIAATRIKKESPTNVELGTKTNWSLAYKEKNIRMGMIKSNG